MEIKVMHQVMEWNEDVSDAVKADLAAHHVCLINVLGSPGAGKTSTIVSLIDRPTPTKFTHWVCRWFSWTPTARATLRP